MTLDSSSSQYLQYFLIEGPDIRTSCRGILNAASALSGQTRYHRDRCPFLVAYDLIERQKL